MFKAIIWCWLVQYAIATKILIIGDSWGSFAGEELLENACYGSVVKNVAVGGTRARRWAEARYTNRRLRSLGNFVPDYAWLTIGGNEFVFPLLADECEPEEDPEVIAFNIRSVVELLTERFPNIKIILTGYGIPRDDFIAESCDGSVIFSNLQSVFVDYDYPPAATVVPIEDLFGGSYNETSYTMSNASLYRDFIHLNDEGYNILFNHEPFVEAIGGCSGGEGNTDDDVGGEEPNNSFPFQCFPESTTVEVKGRGIATMDSLSLGDVIKVGPDQFEPVYSFGHLDTTAIGQFLEIETESGDIIQLSEHHMIETDKVGNFVPARMLQIDKSVIFVNDGAQNSLIKSIKKVRRHGLYAPFTPSGKLLVNGISVSSFVSLSNKSSYVRLAPGISISFQWLEHSFEFPHRLACYYLSGVCSEAYGSNGISTWASPALLIVNTVFNFDNDGIGSSSWMTKVIIALFVLPLFGIFACTEVFLQNPVFAVTIALIIYSLGHCYHIRKKIAA